MQVCIAAVLVASLEDDSKPNHDLIDTLCAQLAPVVAGQASHLVACMCKLLTSPITNLRAHAAKLASLFAGSRASDAFGIRASHLPGFLMYVTEGHGPFFPH